MVGSARENLHKELVDLAHGTSRPLFSDIWEGVWSPDGKWIAGTRDNDLWLIDAHELSKRRALGGTSHARPAWSPDSRYLLLWKYSLFKCGVFLDVDGPATLEALDIESGSRSVIQSSQCRVEFGSAGWMNADISK
jgi:hypothetical protein